MANSLRVTDEMVRSALAWARNYEEISEFELVAKAGRKWRVKLARPILVGSGFIVGRPQDAVPPELVFTSREALAFAYGCAVAGHRHGRAEYAKERWGWDE